MPVAIVKKQHCEPRKLKEDISYYVHIILYAKCIEFYKIIIVSIFHRKYRYSGFL